MWSSLCFTQWIMAPGDSNIHEHKWEIEIFDVRDWLNFIKSINENFSNHHRQTLEIWNSKVFNNMFYFYVTFELNVKKAVNTNTMKKYWFIVWCDAVEVHMPPSSEQWYPGAQQYERLQHVEYLQQK